MWKPKEKNPWNHLFNYSQALKYCKEKQIKFWNFPMNTSGMLILVVMAFGG